MCTDSNSFSWPSLFSVIGIFKYSLDHYSLDHVTKDEWQDRNFFAIEMLLELKVKTRIDIPFSYLLVYSILIVGACRKEAYKQLFTLLHISVYLIGSKKT